MNSAKRFAAGVFGVSWKSARMVFLNAYLDASKDRYSDRVVVAGYSGQAAHFAEIEERWKNLLAVDGMDYFHVHDFRAKFRDWEIEIKKYAQLLAETELYGIIATIEPDAWVHIDEHPTYRDRVLYQQPHHACLDLAFDAMADALASDVPTNNVAMYIDNDYGRVRATEIYDAWSMRAGKEFQAFTVLPDGASKTTVPLQFADLLANGIRLVPMHWTPIKDLTPEIMDQSVGSPFNIAIKRARIVPLGSVSV